MKLPMRFAFLDRPSVPSPAPSVMRTVNPGEAGVQQEQKPSSRCDVLRVIEDNVKNEIDAINHELDKIQARENELIERLGKYKKVLEIVDVTGS